MWRTNLKVLAVAALVLAFYTTIAHTIPQLQPEVPEAVNLGAGASPEALVAAGEKIFNGAGNCTSCHGLGTRAPNLLTDEKGSGEIGARCGKRKPGMDCKAYLYESLTDPKAYVVKGYDPIMQDQRRTLSPDQIWAVIAFLESQGGQMDVTAKDLSDAGQAAGGDAAPAAAPAGGTTDPLQIIQTAGGTGCHQLAGQGGAVGP